MAEVRIFGNYRTYSFTNRKNPVIDKMRTLIQDEGLFKKLAIVHELSGVATSTLNNWFHGDTLNPQHGTIAAVVTSLGYEEKFVKVKELDIERERKVAAEWLERQGKKKKRTNGHAKKGK